jgi:hypothetical protein
MKGRTATEWLLTEFADDTTATTAVATQDFMRWSPVENSNNSPATGTLSPASGPQVALRRDRVA